MIASLWMSRKLRASYQGGRSPRLPLNSSGRRARASTSLRLERPVTCDDGSRASVTTATTEEEPHGALDTIRGACDLFANVGDPDTCRVRRNAGADAERPRGG